MKIYFLPPIPKGSVYILYIILYISCGKNEFFDRKSCGKNEFLKLEFEKSCGKNEFYIWRVINMIITMFKVCVLMCMAWISLGLFLFVMWLATVFLGYLIDWIKDKFEK